ncbi:MAG: MaoC/PaaZ C-terminal domain-containing protein [Anaerolineales bacterium]
MPQDSYIDVEQVLGYEFEPSTFAYDERDVSLYALGVGAAADPLDDSELRFVYEQHPAGMRVLPTFAVTFPFAANNRIFDMPGLKFHPMLLLHGEQVLELKAPLAPRARLTNRACVSQVYDKGSGALILLYAHSYDEDGREVAFNRASIFIRGLGGFGGERGTSRLRRGGPSGVSNAPPERPPDVVHSEKTRPDQALLYRLSGDRNPLHADPSMAAQGGFDRPILHGLCTFGFGGRAVLRHFCDNDPARFKSIKVRFTKHVFPGETLVTEMWHAPDGRVLFQMKAAERDEIVISNAAVMLNEL